ncbi:shootin-1-like [Sinocyclocheilus anshuiensis]|uniref:shootin-1-like n=1 Tax=Sinocyclocheilus anshuiensis TaxID=1608454 RepID=UPI0007B79658|nr:PREDICTED: shootin-1-like [Sinocyclocheilus anshuiensis]
MWNLEADERISDSEEENTLSSEDEIDIECEILEKERDEANEKLSRMEEASAQLLKELDVLEMQFQIERSCRETAESFALKVNKDFKALKRQSQAILPLIPEMPENFSILNLDPEADPSSETVSEEENSEDPLLMSQNQIRELQSSVDRLLGEKIQLTAQVELLKKEKEDLKDKLVLEVREKEALLRKQSRTVNKMKRVSQLVTEEFTEMSQKFEMEQGLRQHAEVFAHQMLVKQQETQRQIQNAENEKQLQQALSQVTKICKALEEIRLYYQNQMSQTAAQDLNSLSDLAAVRTKLEISEKERSETEIQLRDSKQSVTALQEEIKLLKDKLKEMEQLPSIQSIQLNEAKENPADPPSLVPPAPPPPPPPPPSSAVTDPLKALRIRKKGENSATQTAKPAITEDMKARAVDEMMERIKKGIILKPILRTPQAVLEDENVWKEQRSDNRKSAVLELQEMLVSTRRPGPRRVESKKRFSRNVGEAELQMVLQRRRRAMGDEKGTPPSPSKPKDPPAAVSVSSSSPWAGESGSAPVLRRLQQNREKRISRIKASESIIWEEK